MATDILAHIQEGQVDASMFERVCHTFSIGPASLELCINLNPISVQAKLSILGVTVANCLLDATHQQCKLGGSFSGFKAEVVISLNIPAKTITIEFKLCAPIIGCTSKSFTIHF
jgi:hypothetical protein